MKKYKRVVWILYGLCVLMVLFVIISIGVQGRLKEENTREFHDYAIVEGYEREIVADADCPTGEKIIYRWKLQDIPQQGASLGFYICHHYVEIYIGGEKVYSLYPDENNIFGRTTACNWPMVPLYYTDTGAEIEVVLIPLYTGVLDKNVRFYQGVELSIYLHVLKASLPLLVISIMAIVVGLLLIVITFVFYRSKDINNNLAFLGMFSITVGVWKMTDMEFAPLLFRGNTLVLSYITLTMLLILPIPLVLFIKSQLGAGRYRILYSLCNFSIIVSMVLLVLQIFDICDLRASLFVAHIVLTINVVCVACVLLYECGKNKLSPSLKVTIVGTLCASAGMVVDMSIFYYSRNTQGVFWGLLCYVCCITYISIMVMKDAMRVTRDALYRAEAANRTKTIFLSNMSHDIRTPMNAIIGFNSIAKKNIDNKERVEDCLNKIDASSTHLLRLINDVLDMSRIESGKTVLKIERHNVREMFQNVYDVFNEQMAEKNIHFTMDIEGVVNWDVYCDLLRINQVIYNLLSNAMKYTPQGGRVEVKVIQLPGEDTERAYYEFRVKDNGIGMSPEFCKHAFEMFERERSTTESNVQGTGLGLAISKSIIDLAGGTIELFSELGKGTEFVIHIDFRKAEPREAAAKEEEQKLSFADKRILLVEDNELNREIALEILTEIGFAVETAEDGVEAVEKVRSSRPGYFDLILMDIQMPNMNGYQATREIRALPDAVLANIPIIAMTANAFEEDRQKAFAAGMVDHVAKPIDVDALLGAINRIFKLSDD